ncbi:MAG: glycyl-radical enzyme activating protein [Asgard group archaeon]|nr:glycyl-radical enzyme activating protein [Asgard group archaeon]
MNNMVLKGLIFDIKKFAVHDGPGIRTTVFFKGCPMDCWWCHNPESHSTEPQTITQEIFSGSSSKACFERKELIGREISLDTLVEEIMKDKVFYDISQGGVSFSGGEPLMQSEFLLLLLKKMKELGLHTVVDTSGCGNSAIVREVSDYVDLFLYDLKIVDEEKHEKYTGKSNSIIKQNLKMITDNGHKVIIRIPIIPTINDNPNDIKQFGEFLSDLNIVRVELLPFHKIGEEKYRKLNKINRMKDIQKPTKKDMISIKERLEKFGLVVKIEE